MESIQDQIANIKKKNIYNHQNNINIPSEQRKKKYYPEIPQLSLVTLNRINNLKKYYPYLTYYDLYRIISLRDQLKLQTDT